MFWISNIAFLIASMVSMIAVLAVRDEACRACRRSGRIVTTDAMLENTPPTTAPAKPLRRLDQLMLYV
jgi:hypothetical protein